MLTAQGMSPEFEDVAEYVAQSVIAIAIGTRKDGSPNILGTGFALNRTEFFATSWHVAATGETIRSESKKELAERKLKDKTCRIALPEPDGEVYEWHEVDADSLICSYNEDHDTCVYRMIGVEVPALKLLPGDLWLWGSEVGIIGFPMGSLLQGLVLRPYVLKTVISGGPELPLDNGNRTPRLALGTAVAGGFSGGPVFSTQDGKVAGMVSSSPIEEGEWGTWPAGISLAVTPSLIREELESHIKRTDEMIKRCLWSENDEEKKNDLRATK